MLHGRGGREYYVHMSTPTLAVVEAAPIAKPITSSERIIDPETTTEFLFACAYIENGGNATEAAMKVFKPGKKGAKGEEAIRNSAHAMGSRMLRNVTVQRHLEMLVANSEAGVHNVLKKLSSLMQEAEQEETQRKSAVDLLKYHGKYEREPTPPAISNTIVNISVPSRKAGS